MAAFRRRTAFAAPLIVIAGCGGKDANDPKRARRIQAPTWSVHQQQGTCRADVILDCPDGVACNPPAPREIECPPGATETMTVVVVEKADKTCAIVPAGCAALDCATQVTPCPKPYEQAAPPRTKLVAIWSIQVGRSSPDRCDAYDDLACSVPAGQPAPPCNPPSPRAVVCPTGFERDKPMRIGQLPDGTCVLAPLQCKDTSCTKDPIACPEPTK